MLLRARSDVRNGNQTETRARTHTGTAADKHWAYSACVHHQVCVSHNPKPDPVNAKNTIRNVLIHIPFFKLNLDIWLCNLSKLTIEVPLCFTEK